jgi:hypothetical protein
MVFLGGPLAIWQKKYLQFVISRPTRDRTIGSAVRSAHGINGAQTASGLLPLALNHTPKGNQHDMSCIGVEALAEAFR